MSCPLTYVVTAEVPPEGVADFAAYEDSVLPLMADHGVRLVRRLRTPDGTFEVHLLEVASTEALASYRVDGRRTAYASLLERSGAQVSVRPVDDVATEPAEA